jgi:carbamoyltransferase
VLGISGLARAMDHKRRHMPGLDAREYAIFQGADAAAALVAGGRVVAAAAEERFDGVKHSSAFPRGAAAFCLELANVRPAELDYVAHSFSYGAERRHYMSLPEYYRTMYDEVLAPEVTRGIAEEVLGVGLAEKFVPVPHHLAHAASAYVPSGFDAALVLVSDGLGERSSATVLAAEGDRADVLRETPAHSSIGLLYGLFTLYLGFWFGDGEYKVMGLAPYGDPTKFFDVIMSRWISLEPAGDYLVPLLLENHTVRDKETYRAALAVMERELGPRRSPQAPIEQRHMDVAAALQMVVQKTQLHLLRHFQRETGLRRLCLAGGVALNCVANGTVLRSGLFEDLYVQPAAGDDGAALGAALHASGAWGRRLAGPFNPRLGPEYDLAACLRAARGVPGLDLQTFDDDDSLAEAVARLIARGGVVGWFQERMEFGPRALGSRSILGDPRRVELRDRINAMVKKREAFRPFAPAVLAECAGDWFEIPTGKVGRFADMLFVTQVHRARRRDLPAVTHVDGSARVQTVSQDDSPRFWKLIRAFGRHTGVPVVLNTSFNVQGQPIVRTPDEAVLTLRRAGLDALVMDRLLVVPAVPGVALPGDGTPDGASRSAAPPGTERDKASEEDRDG